MGNILSDNTFLLAALGIFLTMLVLVQVFLALRHDHVVSAQGRIATLEALDSQIESKRTSLLDLDEDLAQRRTALSDLAGMGAEVDALQTKRDELLTEWNMMDAKREEIRALRSETEQIWTEKQKAAADLQEANAELDNVRARLEKAENLVGQINGLEQREDELRAEVQNLQHQANILKEAEMRVASLEERERGLQSDVAALEGRQSFAEERLSEISAKILLEQQREAEVASELEALRAGYAAAKEAAAKQKEALAEQKSELEEITSRLSTAKEMLDVERRKLQGAGGTDSEASVEDRLKELNTRPEVLNQLELWPVWRPSGDRQPEVEALARVSKRFETVGLRYHPRTLRAFHTSMKVNQTTQMTVLAGISGTGKSQLPRQYAAGMGIGFLQVPVQPRWDSPQDLMGFFNYIEGKFRPTDLARALWQLDPLNNSDAIADRMMMVLLYEMNLARVEYYFSDFLSRLESRPSPEGVMDTALRKDAEIELEIPMPKGVPAKRVFPGFNLLFTGTMNEDESTQSLSDKVVDRANVMRFGAPPRIEKAEVTSDRFEPEALSREQWQKWLRATSSIEKDTKVSGSLEKMRQLMSGFKKPFGHRLGRAMLAYVANYPEIEGVDRIREALSDQVEMRLLPKLRGVEIDNVDTQFDDLKRFVVDDLGDETLAEAIEASVEAARDGSGQFVWTGVTRG